jgi:hypothetical protein
MFNPFKSEVPAAQSDDNFSKVSKEARDMIEGSDFLRNDKTAWSAFSQFEDGADIDVIDVLKQREATLKEAGLGASAPEIDPAALVQHSKAPEMEHGSLSQE